MFICLKFLTPPVSILSNIKTLDRNRQTETINKQTETINDHFTNVAQVLAQDIAVVDFNPESYLEPTDHSFSPQIRRGDIVSNILLNSIFSKSILKGIYPIGKQPKRLENNLNDRKRAKVTPLFKKRIT